MTASDSSTARPAPKRRARAKKKPVNDTAGPGIFAVTEIAERNVDGAIERIRLADIELACNPRKDIADEGLDRLAAMLARSGQFIPAIGRRIADDKVLLYDGQRRFLAAQRSYDLVGTEGYEGLEPVAGLIVLLLDYAPTDADIRRIQAQVHQREDLSMPDQIAQFRECWEDRAGLPHDDRIAVVCADLGIAAKKARNLLSCLTLPEDIRGRVAERPTGLQISIGMENVLADMQQVSPQLVNGVAAMISTRDLHDKALRDIAGAVHRTVVADPSVYAVRIDDGALLDAHEQIDRAREHLGDEHKSALTTMFAREKAPEDQDPADAAKAAALTVEQKLDALSRKARDSALMIRVDSRMRERAANVRCAYVASRGVDYADGIWVVDPVFLIECAFDELQRDDLPQAAAGEDSFFKSAGVKDDEMQAAKAEADAVRAADRARRAEAITSNQGLGADIRAGLMDPHGDQLRALRDLVCHLVAGQFANVIAYGAGWTDPTNQQPVGDTQRFEPRPPNEIVAAELDRALSDPDPLAGIATLMSRLCAAFLLDPDGVTKGKVLGTERMARELRDALPAGANELRAAVWEFMRPMLSPRLRDLHRDTFVIEAVDNTVDLDAHRSDSDLDALDLGDDDPSADAA
jgi:hypothetical protein